MISACVGTVLPIHMQEMFWHYQKVSYTCRNHVSHTCRNYYCQKLTHTCRKYSEIVKNCPIHMQGLFPHCHKLSHICRKYSGFAKNCHNCPTCVGSLITVRKIVLHNFLHSELYFSCKTCVLVYMKTSYGCIWREKGGGEQGLRELQHPSHSVT